MTTEDNNAVQPTRQEAAMMLVVSFIQKLSNINIKFSWLHLLKLTVLFSAGFFLGTMYGWNTVTYVGANILDLPPNTHLPVTLSMVRLLFEMRHHPYSTQLVIEVFNDLYINDDLICEAQRTYSNAGLREAFQYTIQLLKVSCQ